jgi:hypothetical protein
VKKFLLVLSCLTGFCVPSFAQTLSLVSPTNSATVTESVGSTFALDIDYTSTGTTATTLAGFNVTLSGSSSAATSIPTGLTFDGFSGLNSGFSGAVSGSDPLIFSAAATSPSNDISSTSPTTLLVATFTVNTAGNYSLFFAPPGNTATDDEGLINASANPITPFTAVGATVMAPEPNSISLCLTGMALLFGFGFYKRASA